MTDKEIQKLEEEAKHSAMLAEIEIISFEELEKKINSWFLIKDSGIIKLLCAAVIANKMASDPVWIFIIAPSGGLKSELIQGLEYLPEIYQLSSLTQNTLVSGQIGKYDPSLLPMLNGKILTFKDFTTILQLYHEARNEIMSQFREIYDGAYTRRFGSGREIKWKGKIGFIAGVTPIIDITQGSYASLGERFIQYRIIQPPRKEVSRLSLKNSSKIKTIRIDLKKAFYGYFKAIKLPKELPQLPDEYVEEIINLTDFITLARSAVIRENSSSRDIIFKPDSEMPTRFANQLSLLASSFMIINENGKIKPTDTQILFKIALDSIPQLRRIVLQYMAQKQENSTEGFEIAPIASDMDYPTTTIRRVLEDLNILGVVMRKKQGTGQADLWKIRQEWYDLLIKYDDIKQDIKLEKKVKILNEDNENQLEF